MSVEALQAPADLTEEPATGEVEIESKNDWAPEAYIRLARLAARIMSLPSYAHHISTLRDIGDQMATHEIHDHDIKVGSKGETIAKLCDERAAIVEKLPQTD